MENEYPELPMPEDAPATIDNILQYVSTFSRVKNFDHSGWEHLRGELLYFAANEVKRWPHGAECTMKDISPALWGFFQGYMSCNDHYFKEISQILEKMKKNTLDNISL